MTSGAMFMEKHAARSMPKALFVCAPGAGGHKDDRSMLRLAAALAPQGFEVLRFDFPYRAKGAARIDPMAVLKEAFRAVVASVEKPRRLIIGGGSMGGRVASLLAAGGFRCDGALV